MRWQVDGRTPRTCNLSEDLNPHHSGSRIIFEPITTLPLINLQAIRPSPTPNRANGFDFSKLEIPPEDLYEFDLKPMLDKAQSAGL